MQAVVVSLLLLAAPPVSASGAQKPGATGNPEWAALARVTCSRIESLQKEVDRLVESLADAGIDRAELDSRIRPWRRRARELEIRVHRFAALREADWLTFERRVNQDIDRLDSDLDAVTRDLPPGRTGGRLGRSRVRMVWPRNEGSAGMRHAECGSAARGKDVRLAYALSRHGRSGGHHGMDGGCGSGDVDFVGAVRSVRPDGSAEWSGATWVGRNDRSHRAASLRCWAGTEMRPLGASPTPGEAVGPGPTASSPLHPFSQHVIPCHRTGRSS